MPAQPTSPLLAAVAAYKRAALGDLAPEQVQEGVRLLKEVNRRLSSRTLLEADRAALKTAGQAVLATEAPEVKGFLGRELMRFYNAAFAAGLMAQHPLTEAVQLPAQAPTNDGPEGSAVSAEIVSGLIAEGLAAGLMLSPLALPTAELGGGRSALDGVLDDLVDGLDARWGALAVRARGLLAVVRVLLPVLILILAVATIVGGRDPVGSRANAAFTTGNAMQQLKIIVNLIDSMDLGLRDLDSLTAIGDRVGVPTDDAAEVFELEKLTQRPTILFLRHRPSGALVMVGPETRATLADGLMRMRR